jgi:hypothetical protein
MGSLRLSYSHKGFREATLRSNYHQQGYSLKRLFPKEIEWVVITFCKARPLFLSKDTILKTRDFSKRV